MGVNLRRRKTFVAQELLYDPQIGPTLQEMSGVGMAEGMGVNMTLANTSIQNATNVSGRQALTSPIEKQGRAGREGLHHAGPAPLAPDLQ